MGRFVESFRRYFLRGLLAFLPVALTIWIIQLVIRFMENGLVFLPRRLRPDSYLPFYFPGIGAIFTVALLWLIGVFVTHFASQKANRVWEDVIGRIPFVRGIYLAIRQLVNALFSHDHSQFRRVVLVEYPRKGAWSLGFVTGTPADEIVERTKDDVVSVFIPKTPNPTNGWYAIVSQRDVVPVDLSVEDAFKIIVSGGIVMPERLPVPPEERRAITGG